MLFSLTFLQWIYGFMFSHLETGTQWEDVRPNALVTVPKDNTQAADSHPLGLPHFRDSHHPPTLLRILSSSYTAWRAPTSSTLSWQTRRWITARGQVSMWQFKQEPRSNKYSFWREGVKGSRTFRNRWSSQDDFQCTSNFYFKESVCSHKNSSSPMYLERSLWP